MATIKLPCIHTGHSFLLFLLSGSRGHLIDHRLANCHSWLHGLANGHSWLHHHGGVHDNWLHDDDWLHDNLRLHGHVNWHHGLHGHVSWHHGLHGHVLLHHRVVSGRHLSSHLDVLLVNLLLQLFHLGLLLLNLVQLRNFHLILRQLIFIPLLLLSSLFFFLFPTCRILSCFSQIRGHLPIPLPLFPASWLVRTARRTTTLEIATKVSTY